MAEYKGIHGTKVQDYTTDPDNPITGQVWYNETANTLKFQFENTAGVWSTGANLNTARIKLNGAGTQTSALAFGGDTGTIQAVTEKYNGTAWTEVNDLNLARKDFGGIRNTNYSNSCCWSSTNWNNI